MKPTATPVSNIVKSVIGQLAERTPDEWANLTSEWPKIVGENTAKHSAPYRLANGKLYVLVENSMWAFELSHRYKLPILKKLKTIFGPNKINDISFRVGELCQP
jgi:predicted nucleic acid-binding Zn ribbon protein